MKKKWSNLGGAAQPEEFAKRSRPRGFTLIELVTVLAVIAVLTGGAIHLVKGVIEAARIDRARWDIQQLTTQLVRYEAATGRLPTTKQGLQSLVTKPTAPPPPRNWSAMLEDEALDPWKEPYRYQIPAEKSKRRFDLFSLGPDGIESEDDIGNWKNE